MLQVVLADDEDLVRHKLERIVDWQALGARVVGSFGDGRQALEFCQTNPVNVVLTDIRMPRMGGIELCEALFRTLPAVKTVLISGHADFQYAQSALRFGVQAYLLKPTKPEEVREVIEAFRRTVQPAEDPPCTGLVGQVLKEIEVHFARNISLDALAAQFGVTPPHLSRQIKKTTGQSYVEFLNEVRVRHAKELLGRPALKVYEVAEQVGLKDERYFAELFKKKTGLTPQEYRAGRTAP